MIEDHVPPKNCLYFDPPKLNEEINVSLNETSSKRDGRLVEKQNKITACLALLGSNIVDDINDKKLNNDAQKLYTTQASLLRKLSEATRLLADLQRDETLTRRSLILATINSSLKEALESSMAHEWLFGQKLGERLKAAKTIEKSGKDLMEKSKNPGKPKNSKAPPRRQPFKSKTWGGFQNNFPNQFQSTKRNWVNQNRGQRNSFQSKAPTQQRKI